MPEKTIKFKQFIQQLHHSSRSSNLDQSVLSQRSFRQNYTFKDQADQIKNQAYQKLSIQSKLPCDFTDKKLISISHQISQQQKSDLFNHKLYTFCDAKITQKSIEILNGSNYQNNVVKEMQRGNKKFLNQDKKYFRTCKQINQEKQNINIVNKFIQKVQNGNFEANVLKRQREAPENISKSPNKNLSQKQTKESCLSQTDPKTSHSSSFRKIQSVKKISLLSKQPSRESKNLQSKQKSPSSLNKKIEQKQKESDSKLSSKKKIISLNINPLKSNLNQERLKKKIKFKLCLDKSCQQGKIGQKSEQSRNIFSNQMSKMPSLEHSKIESLNNEGSKGEMLMSKADLFELNSILGKELQNKTINSQDLQKQVSNCKQKQEIAKFTNQIQKQNERQKKPSKVIYQLDQKNCHSSHYEDKRQIQILQKDCARLTNSYKEIRKLYESTIKQNEEIQSRTKFLIRQNADLKECLGFKSHESHQLHQKITLLTSHANKLSQQLKSQSYPLQLNGLLQIIKQKLTHYEVQIASLLQQNHKLTILREKLENYNFILKQEIQEKQNLIWSLERQLKDVSPRQKSCRDQIEDCRQNEQKLNKVLKQVQSKLRLANIHNEYLTKQIVLLKQQKRQMISCANTPHLAGGPANSSYSLSKLGNFNTLTNTITTRNSSMCNENVQTDNLLNTLQHNKKKPQNQILEHQQHFIDS